MTKENKNWTSFKNFAPKLNLNQNMNTAWNEAVTICSENVLYVTSHGKTYTKVLTLNGQN